VNTLQDSNAGVRTSPYGVCRAGRPQAAQALLLPKNIVYQLLQWRQPNIFNQGATVPYQHMVTPRDPCRETQRDAYGEATHLYRVLHTIQVALRTRQASALPQLSTPLRPECAERVPRQSQPASSSRWVSFQPKCRSCMPFQVPDSAVHCVDFLGAIWTS
jgi:hypothetical protein